MTQHKQSRTAQAVNAAALSGVRPTQGAPAATAAPAEKLCRKCGRLLPAEAFHRQNNRPSGLQSYCKECRKADRLTRRAAGRGRSSRGAPDGEAHESTTGRKGRTVTVSFEGLPDLFRQLLAVAERQERTVEGQIRYWVRRAVEGEHAAPPITDGTTKQVAPPITGGAAFHGGAGRNSR